MKKHKPSKMRNVRTTIDGIKFDSKKEANRYSELKLLQKAESISGLQIKPAFPISINDHNICKYIADFSYTDINGQVIVEDVKGRKTGPAWQMFRLKQKLMKAIHGIEVKVI